MAYNKASGDLKARFWRLQQTVCMNALHAWLHERSRPNMSSLAFLWWIDMILRSPVVIYDHSVINLFFIWQSVKTCSNDTLSKFSMLVDDTVEHTQSSIFFLLILGLPRMMVVRNYYGVPSPLSGPPLNIQVGDIIELIEANIRSSWWKVRQFYIS